MTSTLDAALYTLRRPTQRIRLSVAGRRADVRRRHPLRSPENVPQNQRREPVVGQFDATDYRANPWRT